MDSRLMFCKEINSMGIILDCNTHLEMVTPSNFNNKIAKISKAVKLEKVEYIVSGNVLISDGMVFLDVNTGYKYVFSFNKGVDEIDILRNKDGARVNNKTFRKWLTHGEMYDIIKTVSKTTLRLLNQSEVGALISSLNGNSGTMELLGNIRTR